MSDSKSIAIVGPGKLGSALARALRRAGYRIREVVVRDDSANRRAAAQLARRLRAKLSPLSKARLDAQVIWICVPDDSIAEVAGQLAGKRTGRRARRGGEAGVSGEIDWRSKIVLHSSGALSSRELGSLGRRGAAMGSAHPMMTFAHGAPTRWQGIPFAIEGDTAAVRFGRDVARRLGLSAFNISGRSKPLYHAVGSFASPILVGLLSVAERVARAAGVEKPPREMMGSILAQTMEHYLTGGTEAAFAGPMQRGDLETVRRHLRELRRVPGALGIYRALALEIAEHLPVKRRAELKRLLRSAS